ncbi:MAG: methyltransferase domain-containing protein [Anaerolineae bacterium]|nr:methyltransferase domain-containing protein [Anaerolineae bacterium]
MNTRVTDTAQITAEAFNQMASFDYEAIVDGELKRFWGWSYHDFVDTFLGQVPQRAFDRILDVATGTSVIPRKLIESRIVGQVIFGLDLTMGMLQSGKHKIAAMDADWQVQLTNANALAMPYPAESFDLVLCCLATHHMGTDPMLAEMRRILKPGGVLMLADVSAAKYWRWWFYKPVINLFTLVYFTLVESLARARAEMASFPNILTQAEWRDRLAQYGFSSVNIIRLTRKFFWIPNPVIIQSTKEG